MGEESGSNVFPIGLVERKTGLSARRIRYYEKMELLRPRRTQGNQRLYSQEDVNRLLEIKRLLAEGLGLAGIRQRLNQQEPGPAGGGEETWEDPDIRTHLGREVGLTSLYPVSNQAELSRVIEESKLGEEK